ncbi:MAG: UDP-N-acetylmuramate dehydrogenase [Lachnospiraceae bacterium]|nr:UDP-N-acetylmuramate dehydrogenase [Lachnospiraceae bacterium]
MNISKLEEIISKDKIKYDEPLKNHTSFRTGGPADVLISVSDVRELLCVLKFVEDEKVPYFLLGNGSNVLASDAGFRGAIIKLEGEFLEVKTDGEFIGAGAGVTLSKLANAAMNASLSGLEFASGIPGTLGGALFMNAGAYGGEMCRVVTKVKALDVEALKNGAKNPEDAILEILNEDMKFGYRRSVLKEKGYVALSCEMKLEKSDSAKIKETMLDLNKRRKEKQPLEFPSAGSTFKRPEGYFAGKLIEDAGLGGYTIGGAQVSEKHKGFIINTGNASSKDIKSLMDHVTETVKNQSGVTLEPEVIFLGSFDN